MAWAGPIHRSRFDMGKCERTVEGILAGACCVHLPPAAADRHLIFFTHSRKTAQKRAKLLYRAGPAVMAGTRPAHSLFQFDSDPVTPVTEGKCRPD